MRGGKQGIRDLSLLKFGLDLLPYPRNVAARFGIVPKLPHRGRRYVIPSPDQTDEVFGTHRSGNDWLWGGMGGDSLTGGIGADTFSWNDTAESGTFSWTRDNIVDFNRAEGDRLDLANIDANIYTPGNQVFTFIGTADFSGIGQIRYYHDDGNTYIEMQTSIPTSDPEGVICLHGIHTPDASWFVL
jgi:RTX calcium-binding nonapeptide repeat (4 copies)